MSRRTVVTVTLAALTALSFAPFAAGCRKSEASNSAGAPAPAGKRVAVVAGDDGFAPSEIKLAKGEAATLVFTRTSDKTCATTVVFPELKWKSELPLGKEVTLEIPTGEARTLLFHCGMGMYRSKVVIQ